ncbi:MAG: hypothetical protein K2Y21_00400 [Phycisphaerales bacterium]|nr:hypothetical protein [Phycisphaerales bacterium]
MRKRLWSCLSLLAVLCLTLAPIGCTALPDVTPFATSSREFASAVKVAGKQVREDLQSEPSLAQHASTFATSWDERNRAMNGMIQYSESLVAIVQATKDARTQAKALGDKLEVLAGAAGIVNPAAGAGVAVGIDVASFVYGQIALVRGAASLEEAMTRAQPVVDKIAEIITQDAPNLRMLVGAVRIKREQNLNSDGWEEVSSFLAGVNTRRTELRNKGLQALSPAERSELAELDRLAAPAERANEKFEALDQANQEKARATLELIEAVRSGVAKWSAAHRSVADALRERQPVSVESLIDAAVEIRDLGNRIKELRRK